MSDDRPYPRLDGAFLQLGPEVFTGDGVEQPQDVIMWKGGAYKRTDEETAPPPRTWFGEALAAYDQALVSAGDRDARPGPDFWVNRAAAAAAIESAQQQRIANLIAWKQLRQTAPASSLPLAGDAVSDEIERALGITPGGAA